MYLIEKYKYVSKCQMSVFVHLPKIVLKIGNNFLLFFFSFFYYVMSQNTRYSLCLCEIHGECYITTPIASESEAFTIQ